MLSHSYYLDKPSDTEPSFVFLNCNCSDGRLKFSLREKAYAKEWVGIGTRKQSNVNIIITRFNRLLDELRMNQRTTGEKVTRAMLREKLADLVGEGKPKVTGRSFTDILSIIIDERSKGLVLNDGKRFKPETIKAYTHTKSVLDKYMQDYKKVLEMHSFTMADYHQIKIYLTNEKQLSLNSVGKHLKHLKMFIKDAKRRGWHNNMVFADEEFQVPDEETTDIYLTLEELNTISQLPLDDRMEIARDWLLVLCFTALRIGDALSLEEKNITGNTITIATSKTDEGVVIPIHPILRTVLDHNGGWPPKMAHQEFNDVVKRVALKAGITRKVLYKYTKGGVRKDIFYEAWEMVSGHSGRRSFITNALLSGMPDDLVMSIAGIRDRRTLKRYMKASAETKARQAAALPFFKG